MPLLIQYPENPTDAFERAAARGVLPSALGSREQREALTRALRERSVFSARTTNARYLQTLRNVIAELAQGELDMPQARVVLRQTLDALGYTPEGGFPDSDIPVPPAVEGTLQDLRSFRRLDLIVRTQTELMWGAGQKVRGEEPAAMRQFPAWELVRVIDRRVPRDWQERFEQAGGELIEGRIIAMKGDPVWDALGDSALFDDALDVDHPPFAFNSGMRWRAVPREELEELEIDAFVIDGGDYTLEDVLETVPKPSASAAGLDDDFLRELRGEIDAREKKEGVLTMDAILKREAERRGR